MQPRIDRVVKMHGIGSPTEQIAARAAAQGVTMLVEHGGHDRLVMHRAKIVEAIGL